MGDNTDSVLPTSLTDEAFINMGCFSLKFFRFDKNRRHILPGYDL